MFISWCGVLLSDVPSCEVKHVWQATAHRIATDFRFRNRLDTHPCIGCTRLDAHFTVAPWVPKGRDEA